jgi:hypothetical protein
MICYINIIINYIICSVGVNLKKIILSNLLLSSLSIISFILSGVKAGNSLFLVAINLVLSSGVSSLLL